MTLSVEMAEAADLIPKSPLAYPDLCGKHRLQVEVQMMDREIGFLEEELSSLDELQTASTCCEEVNKYVDENPDPLLPETRKVGRSGCLWRCMRWLVCFNLASLCCCRNCKRESDKSSCCGKHNNFRCNCITSCKPCLICPGYGCGCFLSCCRNNNTSCFPPKYSGSCCIFRCN
ncbi:hypothetical protein ZOSMA_81G01080 [Zostera marina]|uniref:G protein gamma domain-containing protein n=1 Tax=Zostera marina TaxID=29655 RepID=A0A0K9NM73_ZOSMR|nr:hypothetical protein ZOSMA_81G01080 [Zostera marina]